MAIPPIGSPSSSSSPPLPPRSKATGTLGLPPPPPAAPTEVIPPRRRSLHAGYKVPTLTAEASPLRAVLSPRKLTLGANRSNSDHELKGADPELVAPHATPPPPPTKLFSLFGAHRLPSKAPSPAPPPTVAQAASTAAAAAAVISVSHSAPSLPVSPPSLAAPSPPPSSSSGDSSVSQMSLTSIAAAAAAAAAIQPPPATVQEWLALSLEAAVARGWIDSALPFKGKIQQMNPQLKHLLATHFAKQPLNLLEDVFNQPLACALFKLFLEEEHSLEHFHFCLEMIALRRKQREIYQRFIADGGGEQVNIDATVKGPVDAAFRTPEVATPFDDVLTAVVLLLQRDSFARFKALFI